MTTESSEVIYLSKEEFPDSIEIGPPGNRLKIYFNASNLDEAKERIENAYGALKRAKELQGGICD